MELRSLIDGNVSILEPFLGPIGLLEALRRLPVGADG